MHEGAGAVEVLGFVDVLHLALVNHRMPGRDPYGAERQHVKESRDRELELYLHSLLINDPGHTLIVGDLEKDGRGPSLALQDFETVSAYHGVHAEHHIFGADGHAIVPAGLLVQVEDVGLSSVQDFPAFCQVTNDH